jgi:DNA-binding transcriptional MerR regulator
MAVYQIGKVSERLGLTVDTLRYYEKIGLLPPVPRNVSGLRVYNDQDISRLQFIQRAQKMNFTLEEIGQLLKMREGPQKARPKVRELTRRKLEEIETYLADLKTLRDELRRVLSLCTSSADGCPIIERIDKGVD